MKQYPSVPRAADAPAGLLDSGHLWLQEQVEGGHLRFRLRESGMLQFGDRTRTFDAGGRRPSSSPAGDGGIPLPYRHAVRHVREAFDREALRAARDDVASVVFFGVATYRRAIDYDWERLPPFLGFDVWDAGARGSPSGRAASDDGDEGQFLPPDAVEQVYDRVGLDAVNAFRKEVRATDFDPDAYEVPDSAWYDGPAAGVVVRNKTGQRATIPNADLRGNSDAGPATDRSAFETGDADPATDRSAQASADAEELAERYATRQRVESVVRRLADEGRRATFDAVFERLFEDIAREKHHRLFGEDAAVGGDAIAGGDAATRDATPVYDDPAVDLQAFRSAVAARTQELLET